MTPARDMEPMVGLEPTSAYLQDRSIFNYATLTGAGNLCTQLHPADLYNFRLASSYSGSTRKIGGGVGICTRAFGV